MRQQTTRSPKGKSTRILLTSVFGPYAQDDVYGSRALNPMELYHNQVTRVQGGLSLRMFHRSFGLMMIQANVDAPCTLLDFPSRERFIDEIRQNDYDVVGISAIVPNIGKVKRMCELVREHRPNARIVVGGHIAGKEDLRQTVDADDIVRGDGIRWFRRFLGEDEHAPIRHPAVLSAFGTRIMGIDVGQKPGDTAAILIPSVGCPVGCNFCCTSALFGGKGHFVNFFETGDELFAVMSRIEEELRTQSFFILDENFLLHKKRALRLLELMETHQKSWSLYVFSSARVLESYTIDELLGLGISWLWMGLEGESSSYRKLNGVDTRALVEHLQSNGIRVLGSSIIGLEHHSPVNIDEVIRYAISHNTVFHQFMLYMPSPGTPLYAEHLREGSLLSEEEFPSADTHGQYRFNYRHKQIRDGQEEHFLLKAFRSDFEANGPSLARLIRVTLEGWRRHGHHAQPRIRRRIARESISLGSIYAGAVWAMRKWCRGNDRLAEKMHELLEEIYAEFGWKARIAAPLIGRYAFRSLRREEARLARGWTYEPECAHEMNAAAASLKSQESSQKKVAVRKVAWVSGRPAPTLARSA
jgi:radical SAM superfamily enzyme YgiQ (UPF0313 family)